MHIAGDVSSDLWSTIHFCCRCDFAALMVLRRKKPMASPEAPAKPTSRWRVAVDIGGTFTDLVAYDSRSGRMLLGKVLSTHDLLTHGITAALAEAGVDAHAISLFLHGSTIVINTLLERRGGRVALLTTKGFRDVYEIGRINRPDAYNLYFKKHTPLIPRSMCFEIDERVIGDGSILRPLNESQVRALCRELAAKNVEAIGIMFLHSYRNPAHERRVQEIIREELPAVFVTASNELTGEYREFERTSTVAANAYVGPPAIRYVNAIHDRLRDDGFAGDMLIIQSTGGLMPLKQAQRAPVRMLESGPASGVLGAAAICAQLELANAVAFDMGGTTAKAGIIHEGRVLTAGSSLIGRYDVSLPIQIPSIDIVEVGTGGGSIAYVSSSGALRVGPKSAGSSPGPACYGRGGRHATVTDANLLLGRLDPDNFLGGSMKLYVDAARAAFEKDVAQPLSLDLLEAASGVVRIANAAMAHAIRGVTTERGFDAGAFDLIVFGGAGPLQGVDLARNIGIRRVLIPRLPGHFCSYGMLFSDLRYDFVRSCFAKLSGVAFETIEKFLEEMEAEGRSRLSESAVPPTSTSIRRAADMRYVGQEHAVTVELDDEHLARHDRAAIKAAFDRVHFQRYSTSAPKDAAELVSLRVTVIGHVPKPQPQELADGGRTPSPAASRGRRQVFCAERGQSVLTPVYARDNLLRGNEIVGPALIEERASTTYIGQNDRLTVDRFGNLAIELGESP